jgi:large exoprotein involved in heme utilization and adhesion
MTGGAQITTDSRSFGRSDDITIQAGNMFLSDRGGQISSQSLFAGDSGNVILKAAGSGRIEISNGFVVSANTFGTGNSGRVDVSASEAVNISGTASGIASQTVPPPQAELDAFASLILGPGATFGDLAGALGLDPATADVFDVLGALNAFGLTAVPGPLVPGDGGNITVNTPVLAVSGQDSAIDSSTAWDGNAGEVDLDVGSLTVSNGAQVRSRSGLTEIGTGNLFVGTGNAGKINVNASGANTITVTGVDSQISTATLGAGAGGDISLNSAGKIVVTDNGSVQASSFGSGDGGTVSLDAVEVDVFNGGTIDASASGTGLAGNISINATDRVVMNNGTISTRAITSDGGNIVINAPVLLDLLDSQIATSVESGVGAGGNIDIDPAAVVLQRSQIIANAFGGPGGNIRIVAGQFIVDQASIVSASSTLGIAGNIEINAPDTNITGKLVPLPKNFLDASKLLRDRCGAARGGTSGFSAQGGGGVPPGPDGYLPSYATGDTSGHGSVTASAGNAIGSSGYRFETAGGPLLAMASTRCRW